MKKNKSYLIIYCAMLLIFFSIIVWQVCHYHGTTLVEEQNACTVDFSEGWTNEKGETISIDKLNNLDGVEPNREFIIRHTLPEELQEGLSLCFRSINIYYQVYADGDLLYDPYVPEGIFYNNTYGARWNYIDLPSKYAGGQLEIRVISVYDSARIGIDNLYLGNSLGVALQILQDKIIAFITCVIMLFVGLLLIVADIPASIQKRNNHELLYLGLFACIVSVWCISETNLLQFFVGDSRMISFISCFSLILVPIPVMLYLDAAFGFRKKWLAPVISILSCCECIVCLILHLSGIADFHDTLTLSHCMLVVSAVIFFVTILRNSFVRGKNQSKNVYRILRGIGLSSLAVATVIDIIRYYRGISNDTAMFVRIGFLVFLLCYGSSSLEKTINAVKLGVQTEFVSQLAYRDGLTGIGNRTAFQEHLVDLEKIKDTVAGIGIIMFDVNDLKYVNDHLGHHSGDEMLVKSAEIIKEAFESEKSDCFRIGGDEFAVLTSGEDVEAKCEAGIAKFQELMEEHNEDASSRLRISIAYGYSIYNKESADLKLMDIYQRADMRMYENKKAVKAAQSGPEEYYREKALS